MGFRVSFAFHSLQPTVSGYTQRGLEETILNRQKTNNSCKRKAVDSVVEKPSKIIRRELTQHENVEKKYFEISMHQAINIIFPTAQIWGCHFHLGQAWYRKIQSLEFAQDFNFANNELGNWLVHLFGLPFLNPIEVGDCFVDSFMAENPENNKIN
ncbi:hypothetical protein QTP88_007082 [Uroleucon formosanum]